MTTASKVYEKFLDFIYKDVLGGIKTNNPVSQMKMQNFAIEFSRDLTLWGSDEVVKHWLEFRNSSNENDLMKMWNSIDGMLRAIRKDLGHINKKIKDFEMLGMMINDIQDLKKVLNNAQSKLEPSNTVS